MKATPLIINWHNENQPIYSAHFEPHGKCRLATAAGDCNVRLWKVDAEGEERRISYLSTLSKHSQAVNVVRWAPKGETLASAGDDGNVILWVPSDNHMPAFGSEDLEDKETWRTKHMCRSSGAEIYDLAWSPDALFFIIGSMDNIARIYSAQNGTLVRQIAEHSHYVQGVAWDPLNEYIATQSSDRSVHIYSLLTKDKQYSLDKHDDKPTKYASHMKMDLPPRRISSNSPAPSETGHRSLLAAVESAHGGSPVQSAPGTPTSTALPMNPPSVISHSRRSSFSSRRSVSPAPSMPLPAVMPMEPSPKPHPTSVGLGMKNASLYANETLTSFFRRLTFTPDGSLLLTPAGQYQTQHQVEGHKTTYEVINTVYIYTRGGMNKPPMAHLPGHKKPSVAVRCSPLKYMLRQGPPVTKHMTIDTSSSEEAMPSLPDPLSKPSPASSVMEPPPLPATADTAMCSSKSSQETVGGVSTPGPKATFALLYRMVYAVATQDSVLVYDTQQHTPICVVSNLHCATFTDLAWSADGLTLFITSSDGFCSTLAFAPGELGQIYEEAAGSQKWASGSAAASSSQTTPAPTQIPGTNHHGSSSGSLTAPSPPSASFVTPRPPSPSRSNSASSVVTQPASTATGVLSNPPLISGQVPSITAANSGKVTGVPITTPPETPRSLASLSLGPKRDHSETESEDVAGAQTKRRRIAPTSVTSGSPSEAESRV